MKERIGEAFDGRISGLTEWGVYVELDETHIEGMSFLRDIEGDFFQFDEQRYEIFGHRTGMRLTLGDPVRIRVKRADLQKRQLDFELLLDERPETLAEKLARSQQKSRKPAAAAKTGKTSKGEKKANGRTADGKRKTAKKSTETATGSKTGKVSREKEAAPARGRGKKR